MSLGVKGLNHKSYQPVSRSCAVAKIEYWRAIGQSNLADRMEDSSKG